MSHLTAAAQTPLCRRPGQPASVRLWSSSAWPGRLLLFLLLAAGFGAIQAWTSIPIRIQADTCQILLAADRTSMGLGPTTIYPKLPEVDWALITHWPLGYPLLISAVKTLTGLTTVQATQAINTLAFALAFTTWTAWLRRCLPPSPTAVLLAVTGSLIALVPLFLWRVNADMILVAVTPLLLMVTDRLVRTAFIGPAHRRVPPHAAFALLGFAVGAVCWIKYLALFLSVGIGLYLLLLVFLRRGLRLSHTFLFTAGSILAIAPLIAVNATWGPYIVDRPAENLAFGFEWAWLSQWWADFTELPLFESHWRSRALWSFLVPVGAPLVALSTASFRKTTIAFLAKPPVLLSMCLVVGMFVMLVSYRCVMCAAEHPFDPPSQPRYLVTVRPFYLLLFVGPFLCAPWGRLRRVVWMPLAACLVWLVLAGWIGPVFAWNAEQHHTTAYGRRALTFKNGGDELYTWLRARNSDNLIVFSNFYDDIALEAHLPAQPIPADADELRTRVRQVSEARNCSNPKVLFVLEPDNMWRKYFPDLHQAMDLFILERLDSPDPVLARYVYVPQCLRSPPGDTVP